MIDFSLTPELEALKARTETFIRDVVIPYEGDPREGRARARRLAQARADGQGEGGGVALPARRRGVGRSRARHAFDGGGVRGRRVLAARTAGAQLRGAGRGQHAPAGGRRQRRAEGTVAPPAGHRRDPLLLLHDRAGRGGFRPRHARGHRPPGRQPLGHQRPQVVHHRLRRREAQHRHGPYLGSHRARARRDDVPRRQRRPRHRGGTPSGYDGSRASPVGTTSFGFDDLRVNADQVLGEIGEGYKYAQVRLALARLTHCMRWLGAAKRAHDIACGYAVRREAFGKPLAEHEGVGFMLADNELDHALGAAHHLAGGVGARPGRPGAPGVVDGEGVLLGGGSSGSSTGACRSSAGWGSPPTPWVERLWREVRPFRIYDGPNEVHRWAIARRIAKKARSGA